VAESGAPRPPCDAGNRAGAVLFGPVGRTAASCLSSGSTILAGVGPVGLGLDPVQGRILSLIDSVFLTRGHPLPGLKQVGPVTGTEVPVHPGRNTIHGTQPTVLSRQGCLQGCLLLG